MKQFLFFQILLEILSNKKEYDDDPYSSVS